MSEIALLFPGQGIQFPKMGQFFYDNYAVYRRTYNEAMDILGWNVNKLCFEGSVSEINRFGNMQVLIFITEIAMFNSFKHDYGIQPKIVMGHSIGEYAALVSSGAVDFRTALMILSERGRLVENLLLEKNERMAIVENISAEKLKYYIKEEDMTECVYISCYNSKNQSAICGDENKLMKLAKVLNLAGASATPLLFSPPMHTKFMDGIKNEFKEFLNKYSFSEYKFMVISNILGRPYTKSDNLAEMLSEHLVKPVLWADSIDILNKCDISYTVEMSPRLLVTPFINKNQPHIETYCYGLSKDREVLDKILGY